MTLAARFSKPENMVAIGLPIICLFTAWMGYLYHLTPAQIFGSVLLELVAVATARWPLAGLWFLVLILPYESLTGVSFAVTKAVKLGFAGMIGIVYLGERSLNLLRHRHDRGSDYRFFYGPLLLLFLASCVISTFASVDIEASSLGLYQVAVLTIFTFGLSRSTFPIKSILGLLRLLVISAAPMAIWALWQCYFGYMGFWGSAEQQETQILGQQESPIPGLFRSSGPFGSSNAAAAYFAVLAFMAVMHAFMFRKHRGWYRLLALLLFAALLSTFSRGALMGFVVPFLVLMVGTKKGRWRTYVAGLVCTLMVAAIFFIPSTAGRQFFRASGEGQGITSREMSWQDAVNMVQEHPLVGWGSYAFQRRNNWLDKERTRHPHNGFLKAFVEQGILGAVSYLGLALFCFHLALTLLNRIRGDAEQLWMAASLGGILVALFTHELVDAGMTIGGSSISILFAIALALHSRILCLHLTARRERIRAMPGDFQPVMGVQP